MDGALELGKRRVAALVAAEETEPNLDHQMIQERVAEIHRALQ